jgi:hypothetical protein
LVDGETYRLYVRQELGLRCPSSDSQCDMRLAIAIAIEILVVLCSEPMRERYPFLIALREPYCLEDWMSFNRSINMANANIVVFS